MVEVVRLEGRSFLTLQSISPLSSRSSLDRHRGRLVPSGPALDALGFRRVNAIPQTSREWQSRGRLAREDTPAILPEASPVFFNRLFGYPQNVAIPAHAISRK